MLLNPTSFFPSVHFIGAPKSRVADETPKPNPNCLPRPGTDPRDGDEFAIRSSRLVSDTPDSIFDAVSLAPFGFARSAFRLGLGCFAIARTSHFDSSLSRADRASLSLSLSLPLPTQFTFVRAQPGVGPENQETLAAPVGLSGRRFVQLGIPSHRLHPDSKPDADRDRSRPSALLPGHDRLGRGFQGASLPGA